MIMLLGFVTLSPLSRILLFTRNTPGVAFFLELLQWSQKLVFLEQQNFQPMSGTSVVILLQKGDEVDGVSTGLDVGQSICKSPCF